MFWLIRSMLRFVRAVFTRPRGVTCLAVTFSYVRMSIDGVVIDVGIEVGGDVAVFSRDVHIVGLGVLTEELRARAVRDAVVCCKHQYWWIDDVVVD